MNATCECGVCRTCVQRESTKRCRAKKAKLDKSDEELDRIAAEMLYQESLQEQRW